LETSKEIIQGNYMEKQIKVFGFVIILAVLGVGIFGYVNTKKQTEVLRKKLEAAEATVAENKDLVKEKEREIDSILNAQITQKRKIEAIEERFRRADQEAQLQAQAKAEEEAAKKEKELAKQKADALAKEKQATQAKTGTAKTAAKPGSTGAKTGAKKPVAKKPTTSKKKIR
jgi:preprotein translocase subunit SecF